MAVYPHSMSYFNELAGGPNGGHRYLLGSNLDWGQDLLYLEKWTTQHSGAQIVRLAYYGGFNPHAVGIDASSAEFVGDFRLREGAECVI